jgi:selenocysteine lyase/cysteine desulfurase
MFASTAWRGNLLQAPARPDAGIRLGPHYYTSDDELRHVVEQIEEIVATGAHERHLGVVAQH